MATKEIEKTNVTGLDLASDKMEAEYDLVASLLSAANYETADENITEAEMKRNGKFLFNVHLHPISDKDTAFARKKATVYMPNPNNKKLPPIEKELRSDKFTSWLIYLATTDEDKEKIWGNPALMKAKGLMEPWEGVDALLTFGEKRKLSDLIYEISGMDDDDEENTNSMDDIDLAKNV